MSKKGGGRGTLRGEGEGRKRTSSLASACLSARFSRVAALLSDGILFACGLVTEKETPALAVNPALHGYSNFDRRVTGMKDPCRRSSPHQRVVCVSLSVALAAISSFRRENVQSSVLWTCVARIRRSVD